MPGSRLRRSRRGSWCASAAGKTREQFVRDGRLYVPQDVEEQARALMRRHLAGEPLAYLHRRVGVLRPAARHLRAGANPRSDTEVLAGEAIRWLQTQQDARVLDLCAGSGCVGLAVASQVHACRVVLGEKSEAALRICRQNIRRSGLLGQRDAHARRRA
ncbi:MAG: RsmD family RNA methyltransferase [Oscillospiraceae bacterium]